MNIFEFYFSPKRRLKLLDRLLENRQIRKKSEIRWDSYFQMEIFMKNKLEQDLLILNQKANCESLVLLLEFIASKYFEYEYFLRIALCDLYTTFSLIILHTACLVSANNFYSVSSYIPKTYND